MFKHVIVGVDGKEGGRDAIALARMLCSEAGALTLTGVYRREPLAWRGPGAAYEAAARDRVRDLLKEARLYAGVEAELRCQGSNSVGRGLHELAEALGGDLLVVGSSRRGLLGRVLLGDDARAALNGAPCAVAVAPVGYAQRPALMGEIGVGYDGSPESEHALNVARQLAQAHRTRLSAFEAVCLPPTAFSGPPGPDDQLFDELVDAARERVAALEGVEPHAAYGAPTEELAIYSASVDLLVIGSRRHGPARRLMHGSTVRQLARAARCPLLVVERPPERAAATYVSSDEHEKAGFGRTLINAPAKARLGTARCRRRDVERCGACGIAGAAS